jgi:hypothetical protein
MAEAALTGAGEDGAGTTEIPSVAARSGASGWVRRRGRRGCQASSCNRGKGRGRGKRRGGTVATVTVLNRHVEVGDGRWGGTTWQARAEGWREGGGVPTDRRTMLGRQWPETGGRGRRGVAMPRGQPNRGGGRGLIDVPQPRCRAAALADRQARAA